MFSSLPKWVFIAAAVWAVLAVGSFVFIMKECGAKGFLFGNGAAYAAFSGACDQGE